MLLLLPMRILKNILFKFVILLAVLFCLGLDVYSDRINQKLNSEYSLVADCVVETSISDNDPIDNDEINYAIEFNSAVNCTSRIPIARIIFLFSNFSRSSWQPPKH